MNKIKSILAFVALMLCGGVWAATTPTADENDTIPLYWWTFDGGSSSAFNDGQKGQYEANWSDTSNNFEISEKGYAIYGCAPFLNQTLTENAWTGASFSLVGSFKVNLEDKDSSNNQSNALLFGHGWTSDAFALAADASKVYIVWNRSHFSYTDSGVKGSIASEALTETIGDLTTGYHSYALVYDSSATTLYAYVDGVEVIKKDGVTLGSFENEGNKKRAGVLSLPGGGEGSNIGAYRTKTRCDDYRIYTSVLTAEQLKKIAATTYLHNDAKAAYSANFDVVSSEAARSLTASSKLGGTAITPNTSGQRGDWKNEAPTLVASGYDGVNKAMKIKSGQTPYQEGNIVGNADFSLLAVAKMTPATTSPKVIVSVGDESWNTGKKGITLAYFNKTIHVIAWDKSATGSPNFPAAISVSDIPWVESTYHAYLLTYNNTSKAVNLFVDGELKGTKTIDFAPGRTGYQIGGIFGGAGQIKLSVGGENKACAMGDDIYIDEVGIWTKDATSFAKVACVINPVWPMASDDFQWKPSVTAQTVLSYTGNQLQDASGADANIVENGRIFFNSDAEVVIPDTVTVGELIANSGTLKVRKGSSSGVFRGERIIVNPGATLNIDYINNNAPVFPVDTETTIVLNGGSVDSSGWPTVEGAVNFETLVDTTIWSATVCSTGKIIKSGDATLTLGAWLTNRDGDGHPHDVEIKAGTLKLNNAANTVRNLTIAAGASLDFNGSSGSLTIEGKLAVNSADCFTIPSTFTLDTDATVAIASGTLKSTRNDLTIVDVPQGYKAVCSETVDEHNLYTYSFLPLTASVTVGETTTNYVTLSEAITAANAVDAKDNKVMVTLLANSSDAISIDEFVTVDTGIYTISGKITGRGTITFNGKLPAEGTPRSGLTNSSEWTGVIWIKNYTWSSFNFADIGNAESTVRVTGVKGYSGSDNNHVNHFDGTLDLEDENSGSTKAMTFENTYASTYWFGSLTGSGTLASNNDKTGPGRYAFKDVSGFTGTIAMTAGGYTTTFGNVAAASDYVGAGGQAKFKILSGTTATLASEKTWTARDGIFIDGTIKGSGTLGSNTTFGDGATIDLSAGTLAMASAKSVTFSGALNLGSAMVGATVLSGVSTVSSYPTSVTIAGNSDYMLTLDGGNLKVVELPDVAMIGEQGFKTLAKAFEAASANETVTLCANVTGGLTIPANKKVDASAYTIDGAIEIGADSTLTMTFTGERNVYGISGDGTLILNGTGTLNVLNKSGGYAVDGTTIEVNSGTFRLYTGSNGCYAAKPADATTHDVRFVIGKSGSVTSHGWVNFVGKMTCSYSGDTEKSIISNTFRGTPNLIKEGTGTLKFDVSPDGNSSYFATVDVKAGVLKVRNDSLTLPSASSINGPGTLDANLTLADGASVNLNTDALTLGSGRTLRFGASINLVKTEDIADDTVILQGLSSEIAGLSLVDVTVNGAAVENGRLYYDNGAIKYTVAAAETWTPNTVALNANKILDWTAEHAWLDANGDVATWDFSESSMKPNVEIDATKVKGVKITEQVYVGTVVVSGTLGAGESFQFHNHTGSVDGTHEVNASIDCLHTEGVNLASLNGELGMKVPITGPIAFGSNTRLVFATGSKGGDASKAYGYTFVDRGGYITVRGAGKFIVPSSMYGIAFDIESTATAVYQESATINGAITGTGTVEFKNGVTKDLGAAVKDQTLHYVSSGKTPNTLAWTGDGSTSFTSTDSKTKPVVKVESEATLKLNAHDCSGWNGGLTEHGWFVNNGTLVFSKPTGTRFWRDHVVFGPGSTMKIDTGDHHVYLYGGVGTADNCQLTLASGEASIEKGDVNTGKSNYALYIGFTGDGYADKKAENKGIGINVGTDATLTVSVPLMGGDPMAKYGAGTLVLEDNSAYTGSIALYGGSIKAASQINLNRFTSKDPYRPAVSETQEGEMYVYALSYGKIKVDACGYLDVAEAMKHLTTSSTIEIIDTTITKESLESAYGITLTRGEDNTFTVSVAEAQKEGADEHNLIFSEIMPKPVDKPVSAANPDSLARYDENGLESGWVELENTSTTKWVDLANYKFLRVNRSKATSKGDYGNFPSVLIPPHSKFVFYTSERYSNSADMTVSAWVTPNKVDDDGNPVPSPVLYEPELHNMLVWPDKINPKKFPFVRLMKGSTIIDTVVIPSDIPEGHSIIVKPIESDNEATVRYMTNKPTKGTANTALDDASIVKLGPNVGPLYEVETEKKGKPVFGEKHASASEFGEVAMAQTDVDYPITFSLNPTMSPTQQVQFRAADKFKSIKLVYRTWTADGPGAESEIAVTGEPTWDKADQGFVYTTSIPANALPAAGQLIQWKFKVVDNANNEWTTPSFHNKDDGYEWYGTIVEPSEEQKSATLPTWHMFVTSESKAQMDTDAPAQSLPNNARVAIYDSSTKCYYDYVRIDLRGNTSRDFTKKSHGLRFSKVNPLTMTDIVTGEKKEGIRKTSLIAEPADPSRMRQMMAFWLWNKMGNKVPFDFPVRCNLNGAFYQLAFNSERFTDELIEDVYGLDKFGYGYKNVGTLKSDSGTTAGSIEKKTPDDGNETDISVLEKELRKPLMNAGIDTNISTERTAVTKFVVEKFDLPAWLNYLASARITQEMDDVWANISIYYDNAEMKQGSRGTGTWMPLGYDFNLTFGQWYINDVQGATRNGTLMSNQDWFKSHPLYGGNVVRCYKQETMETTCNEGNRGIEAVLQSPKFRRLYLRRLRTLMDQELLGMTGADETLSNTKVPVMVKMREMANLMRTDASLDTTKYPWDSSIGNIDDWGEANWPTTMDDGIAEIWTKYIVPRRQHLFVTHSVNNTTKTVGYGTEFNAGIPNKQSDIATLKANITIANLTELSSEQATELAIDAWFTNKKVLVIHNANNEAVDMSGWKLSYSVEFTLPAGTVVDANDDLYVVADRRAYVASLGDAITDQVIVGNATFSGAGPIMLQDGNGVEVIKIVPMTDARRYLRLAAFYGNTTEGDGQVGEWFELKNIATDGTELNFKDDPITVCFLKDDAKSTEADKHCHVTINSGKLAAGKTVRFVQADYSDKGWVNIQNNKQNINIYDKYGVVGQALKVTQKDYPFAYGHGAFLETTSSAAEISNKNWIQVWTDSELTVADFSADKLNGMAKDLIVRSDNVVITLDDPTFGENATLKIYGSATISGSLTVSAENGVKTAIKAIGESSNLVFAGGSYTITASDDCIQADGDITINGGTFICHSTGNDGIDANQNIVINGGTIFAFTAANEEDNAKSTGLDVNDGHSITINGGTVIATSLEAAALNKLTLAGSQAAKVVAVTGLAADEAKTLAIADILVPFPAMTTVPTAVLVSKPGMTEETNVEAEEVSDGIELVAADGDAPAKSVVVPASWAADKTDEQKVAAAEAFVLGLAEPTEKPMVSSEQTTEANSIRIVDNVAPRFGTGVTVKRTLFVGTTPGEEAADNTIEETNGGFTVPLPKGSEPKVKYIKIKYSFK